MRTCVDEYFTCLHSVYKMFFPKFIEMGVSGDRETIFLFGGYKNPQHLRRARMIHVYFMTMMFLAICWFIVVFVDTAIFRKTMTCNDINVEEHAYVCFDVNANDYHHSKPVDCNEVIDKRDVHVLCYLQYYNFPTAASIAFSFMQLIVFGIYVTFALTLLIVRWHLVTKCKYKKYIIRVVSGLIIVVFIVIPIIILIIIIILDHVNEAQNTGFNFLYGERVPRYFMCVLGCLTLFLLAGLSPYWWLIEDTEKFYPKFDLV